MLFSLLLRIPTYVTHIRSWAMQQHQATVANSKARTARPVAEMRDLVLRSASVRAAIADAAAGAYAGTVF